MTITETLLLLTTALGLAFGVERFLEAVNGLIKRIGLQRGPAAEARAHAIEHAFYERRLDAFDAVIEQTSAQLAEVMVALPSPSESDALPDGAADLNAARNHAQAVARDLAARCLHPTRKRRCKRSGSN